MIDKVLKNRIETALSSDSLMNLFEQLESEGLDKNELENIFTVFLKSAQEENIPESDEEKLFDLLDGITGYCHPSHHLFPPEKYQVYPGLIRFFSANKDRKAIIKFIFENTSFRLFRDSSYQNGELEIKSIEDFDSANHSRFYLWNKTISNEFSIHEQYFEHIQKTSWSFLSDPTFILSFGNLEENTLAPSFVTHAFRNYPTEAAFESIEPIRAYIDKLKVATAIGVPGLQNAFSLNEQGIHFKESPETRWEYKLDSDSL